MTTTSRISLSIDPKRNRFGCCHTFSTEFSNATYTAQRIVIQSWRQSHTGFNLDIKARCTPLKEEIDLPLALLLARNDFECARVESGLLLLLLLLAARATLLGDFGPATTGRFVLSRAGCAAIIDNTLVGKLAATKELLGEMT